MTENKLVLSEKEDFAEAGAARLLLLLLAADFVFLLIHIMWQIGVLHQPLYSLSKDGSYPEHYQYMKELWIAVLLFCICLKTRVWGYFVWAALFGYLMFDDALGFHERGGAYLTAKLDFIPLFTLLRLGEPMVSALVAGLIFPLLAWSYVRGSDAFKEATRHIVLFLFALAFFAVFIDILHIFKPSPVVGYFLKTVEEGGEMLVMSLITWYAYLRNLRDGAFGVSLVSLVRGAFRRLPPRFVG